MLLEVTGLSKSFGGVHAVRDVDLSVEEGTITAIIGPNGAGKSTFFNLLAGFYHPSAGTVKFNGEDITGMKPHKTVKHGIARTFQTTTLFDDATVLENVLSGRIVRSKSTLFGATFHTPGFRREEAHNRKLALEALEFVEIAHLQNEIVANIPQEAQKRVALALALATEPKLLLLDEPAGGITEEETVAFGQLIRKVVARGITVCLVEHKMSMIMSLADKILVLDRGEPIAYGTPSVIQNDPKVIEAYLGAESATEESQGEAAAPGGARPDGGAEQKGAHNA